jgi:hypothetical protein
MSIKLITIGTCIPKTSVERRVKVTPQMGFDWMVDAGTNQETAVYWYPKLAFGYLWELHFEWLDGPETWSFQYAPEYTPPKWIYRYREPFSFSLLNAGLRGLNTDNGLWPHADESETEPRFFAPVLETNEIDPDADPVWNIKAVTWTAQPSAGYLRMDLRWPRGPSCFNEEISGFLNGNATAETPREAYKTTDYSLFPITAYGHGWWEPFMRPFHLRITARIISPDEFNP